MKLSMREWVGARSDMHLIKCEIAHFLAYISTFFYSCITTPPTPRTDPKFYSNKKKKKICSLNSSYVKKQEK